MIPIDQLRIGNLIMVTVSNDAGIYPVLGIPGWGMYGAGNGKEPQVMIDRCGKVLLPESKLKPIKLTPEILEKAGFVKLSKTKSVYVIKIEETEISVNIDLSYAYIDTQWGQASIKRPIVKYLHELQNLTFALTQTELTIQL